VAVSLKSARPDGQPHAYVGPGTPSEVIGQSIAQESDIVMVEFSGNY